MNLPGPLKEKKLLSLALEVSKFQKFQEYSL